MGKKNSGNVGKVVVKGTFNKYHTPTRFKSRSRRQRVKRVRPPKPIAPPKPERPRRSKLRIIYRDLITTDTDQRVGSLSAAMAWYDTVVVYLSFKQEWKLSIPQLREKNAAERSRTAGITSSEPQIKEESFLKAIKSYEKMATVFKPPLISKYLSKLRSTRKKLETRKINLVNKFGEFIDTLDKVLLPKNYEGKRIELRVDKIRAAHRIDSEGNITFDRKVVDNMRRISRKYGLLSGIIQVLPVMSEAAARMPELDGKGFKTGRMVISNSKRYNAVLEMVSAVHRYYMNKESPRKLVRRPKPKKEKS